MTKKTKKLPPAAHPRASGDGDVEVGRRIRILRVDRGLSQDELGKALGVSFQQVQKYEKGINRLTVGRLKQIATVLKVTPHELIGWSDNNEVASINVDDFKLAKLLAPFDAAWKRAFIKLFEGMTPVT
jgi:transcriptional regulator with XRE-family HTH domain